MQFGHAKTLIDVVPLERTVSCDAPDTRPVMKTEEFNEQAPGASPCAAIASCSPENGGQPRRRVTEVAAGIEREIKSIVETRGTSEDCIKNRAWSA